MARRPGLQDGSQPNTRANLASDRKGRFDEWVGKIPAKRTTLNFKHVLLPHVPWQYLPDGRQYRRDGSEPIPQISRQSYKDEGQVEQLQLRHLLQAGFADHELGKVLARIDKLGIYDDALVVVVADHGVSFKKGQFDRRNVNRANIDEITPVPLFIKRPGQDKGTVSRSVVETIDVLPHDRRRARRQAPGEGGRPVGVLGRGQAPHEGHDAQAQPEGLDHPQPRRVRARARRRAGEEGAAVRHRGRRPATGSTASAPTRT